MRHPEYPHHLAWDENAFKLHLVADAARTRRVDDLLALAVGAQKLAEEQARSAVERARVAAWWAQWGFWIGVAGTFALVGGIAGAVIAVLR